MDILVLDLGLGPNATAWLASQRVSWVRPDWDHAFDKPMPEYFKAMVSRPHLPKYLPDADTILWLDADCWVQDWGAVELLLQGAAASGFAIAPEVDRSYSPFYEGAPYAEHQRAWYSACFDEATADALHAYPLINCGVFAARAAAPHWRVWAELFSASLGRAILFVSEQMALNVALRTGDLPVSLMPARCNWICYRAQPLASDDGTLLLDPQPPYLPLGIVHLAGYHHSRKRDPVELKTVGGGALVRPLSFIDRNGAAA